MLYPELFEQIESVRWNMKRDIPWDSFDAALLGEEQALHPTNLHVNAKLFPRDTIQSRLPACRS